MSFIDSEKKDEAFASSAHVQNPKDGGRTQTREVHTASVALAAAVAEQKPNIWSKNMFKLYGIMAVGYLVSTMNGFGTFDIHHGSVLTTELTRSR